MVIRVNKTKDFTVMSNYHLRDSGLSLKAKGLLSVILSLPEGWSYSISGLVAICKESETAVKSALNELKKTRYVIVTKKNPNQTKSGRFEYEYDVYEKPVEEQDARKQGARKQEVENLPLENLGLENLGLYKRTKELITYESITENKEKKESALALPSEDTPHAESLKDSQEDDKPKAPKKQVRHKYGEYSNVLLSDEELGKLKAEFPNDWQERIERVSSYVAQTGKGYKNYLATIRNWARRDAEKNQKKGFTYNDHCDEGDSL